MEYLSKIAGEIETHSVEGIIECFQNGVSPNDLFKNDPLIVELTSEYLRSERFKDCVQAFVDYGLVFEDKILLSVLLNNASLLEAQLKESPDIIHNRYTLRCAFTPLYEVTLLHICAEFNHLACAAVLVKYGAKIDALAGLDENGLGGQTPIFHAVNKILNQSKDMLLFLLAHSANLSLTVKGFIWGKGYEWETLIPAVNPISYAMMGLLPQFHRNPKTIAEVVALLWKEAYGKEIAVPNIPNAYLG